LAREIDAYYLEVNGPAEQREGQADHIESLLNLAGGGPTHDCTGRIKPQFLEQRFMDASEGGTRID